MLSNAAQRSYRKPKMERLRLLPYWNCRQLTIIMPMRWLKGKCSIKKLAIGFTILVTLCLLYVSADHSILDSNFGPLIGWTYNTSRNVSVYIQPENKTSILSPSNICSPSPYLLIMICSAVPNVKVRTALRNTWANKNNLDSTYNSTVKIVFLLGLSDNDAFNSVIAEESQLYNDIIQENFLDTYYNLTLKSVMMLKWVTSNCNQAKYLMKTDDDMFINIPLLMQNLQARSQITDTLFGYLMSETKPISYPLSKWYSPKYMYSEEMYPDFLSGTAYVMSLDVAIKLYHVALTTPLFHLEDVYVTGICAKRAKVRPVNDPGFSQVPRVLQPCILRNAITTHKVDIFNMYKIWSKLNDSANHLSCGNSSAMGVSNKWV